MTKKRLMYQYHDGHETPSVDSGYIYVFGSNLAGLHKRGIAIIAEQQFGAEMFKGAGIMGKSYAIPVKDRFIRLLSISEIRKYVELFKEFTFERPDYKFWITGFETEMVRTNARTIATLFRGCNSNCVFPNNWKPYLSWVYVDREETNTKLS